ncbi:MAG: ABC transporter ATP-binding protein [Burkholderiaceae bacterium]|nr:ABC transporter ATP-binding protein [Burkholderiaceae bacterium]
MNDAALEVSGLTKDFGGVHAVSSLSFSTRRGEILGIIGPNGSGKTTLFNVITGVLPATTGSVRFRGESITGQTTDAIARRGLVRTFQAASVFRQETVYENIRRGSMFGRIGRPGWFFRRGVVAEGERKARQTTDDLLEFSGLADVAGTEAGNLPYGKQKVLGVVIALAQQPSQLLLDEPAAGLNPNETEAMGELIAQIRAKRSVDVVLVEHDIKMVTSVCDRILAINYGKVIALDLPEKIVAHPEVIEAYLGASDE